MSTGIWAVTNSDERVLNACRDWAIRQGVTSFRLKVQVPARDPKNDSEIAAYWAAALDMAATDVRVYRKRMTQKTVPKTYNYGTAHLFARIGATRLYQVWLGQLSQLA